MKTKKKALVMALCAVLLVVVSVAATIAFLTSQDSVENTFTVGKVEITLDESDVDEYGLPNLGADRVKENEYKLIPSHEYTKDPVVHFAAGSEASWLFVKVENGLAAIEADTKIADQILANGWTKLTVTGAEVYYKSVDANYTTAAIDYAVFEKFTVAEDADVSAYETADITITAYAIQSDGLATAMDAWTALNN